MRNPKNINLPKGKLIKKLSPLCWERGFPARMQPGWYWVRNRNTSDEVEARIVYVRLYVNKLAIGNDYLEGWEKMERSEWAGPIPQPL